LIQKEIGDIFQRNSSSIYPGIMLTVTVVRVTPDLSLAKIYISVFPTDKQDKVLEAINQTNKNLRHELGKRVKNQLRVIPELSFYIDDSLDYAENINNLLKE
jgi:ribosome-binding factor A